MGEGTRVTAMALALGLASSCTIAETDTPTGDTAAATGGTTGGSSDESPISYPPVPDDDGPGEETDDPDTGGGWDGTTGSATTASPTTAGSGMMTTAPPPPTDPECSVQEVTEGELTGPVDKGNGVGQIPISAGNALEDYCGCHTLMSNDQNLKFEFLKAPGGTLFLDYDDLSRPFQGGTLGAAMAEQTLGNAMPPGSCFFPGDAAAVLDKWFNEGMPDGATFEPP